MMIRNLIHNTTRPNTIVVLAVMGMFSGVAACSQSEGDSDAIAQATNESAPEPSTQSTSRSEQDQDESTTQVTSQSSYSDAMLELDESGWDESIERPVHVKNLGEDDPEENQLTDIIGPVPSVEPTHEIEVPPELLPLVEAAEAKARVGFDSASKVFLEVLTPFVKDGGLVPKLHYSADVIGVHLVKLDAVGEAQYKLSQEWAKIPERALQSALSDGADEATAQRVADFVESRLSIKSRSNKYKTMLAILALGRERLLLLQLHPNGWTYYSENQSFVFDASKMPREVGHKIQNLTRQIEKLVVRPSTQPPANN